VALAPFARAESSLATRLQILTACDGKTRLGSTFRAAACAAAFRWLEDRHDVRVAPEQEAAVKMALTCPVSILTGGPGTGKTTTLRAILALARAKGLRCVLAAPTGRAAKRMVEATGLPAATLHRLLELRPGSKAGRDLERPPDSDLVFVDEVSMLDALLANQLVKAVPPGAHLLTQIGGQGPGFGTTPVAVEHSGHANTLIGGLEAPHLAFGQAQQSGTLGSGALVGDEAGENGQAVLLARGEGQRSIGSHVPDIAAGPTNGPQRWAARTGRRTDRISDHYRNPTDSSSNR
jgi:hypothetical protein